MKSFHVLMLTIAMFVFLEDVLAKCKNKDKFGVSTKRIIIRNSRRCRKSGGSKKLTKDVKKVKALGRKLKISIKALVADFKSTKNTNSGHGQD